MEVQNLAEDWIFGRVTKPKDPSYLELCQPPTAWHLASIHFGWMVHLWADRSFASRTSTAITPHRKLRLRWSDNTDFETDGNYESRRFLLWAAASTGIPKSSSIQSIQIPFKFIHSKESVSIYLKSIRNWTISSWSGACVTWTDADYSQIGPVGHKQGPILGPSWQFKSCAHFGHQFEIEAVDCLSFEKRKSNQCYRLSKSVPSLTGFLRWITKEKLDFPITGGSL